MKSLFLLIAVSSLLTLSITACSSGSKKAATPNVADKKATAASPATTATKTPVAVETKAATTVAGVMTCTSGADTRNIEIKNIDAGCELLYTKHGETKSMATAKSETAYCGGVSQKIAKNLSAAGFNCK